MLSNFIQLDLIAADSTEAPTNPIIPDIGEVFWGAITFTLLYFAVRYLLLPPITKVMDERTTKVQADKDAAEAAKAKSSRLTHDLDDQLADVRAEANAMVEQARTEASAERATLIAQAEAEVESMKTATAAQIAEERSAAMTALRPEVLALSVDAAQRVLDRSVDPEKAKPVLEAKLGNLG